MFGFFIKKQKYQNFSELLDTSSLNGFEKLTHTPCLYWMSWSKVTEKQIQT